MQIDNTQPTYCIAGFLSPYDPAHPVVPPKVPKIVFVENFHHPHPSSQIISTITPVIGQFGALYVVTGHDVLAGDPPTHNVTIDRTPEVTAVHIALFDALHTSAATHLKPSHTLTGWQPICADPDRLIQASSTYQIQYWALLDVSRPDSPVHLAVWQATPPTSQAQSSPAATQPKRDNSATLAIWLSTVLGGIVISFGSMIAGNLLILIASLLVVGGGCIYGLITGNTALRIISGVLLTLTVLAIGLLIVILIILLAWASCMQSGSCSVF